MQWIKVHHSIRENRKIIKAAEILSVSEPAVIGHMVLLWLWTIENARHGVIDVEPRTIARICSYKRTATKLVDALVESNLLTELEDGKYKVVNFDEHIAPILVATNQNRARQAAFRRRRDDVTAPGEAP